MTWQPAPIIHPDAELWLCDYFRDRLADRDETYATDVYVGNKIPSDRRSRMVIVRRDGGLTTDVFDLPRFGIRVFANTERNATDLALLIRALLVDAPNAHAAAWVNVFSGPSVVDDPSAQPLRYLTAEAALRGADLTA
jgi:hypothetical protein